MSGTDRAGESYYRSYQSGSESGSGSDSDTDYTSDSDSSDYAQRVSAPAGPNFRLLAQGLSLTGLAGQTFDSSGQQLFYEMRGGSQGYPVQGGGYPTFKNMELGADPSGVTLKSASQNVNSIIMLDSRDRDRAAYPQPTDLTLRLPRVYSNVTSFQIVQVKLLSSFFYFRLNKRNTDMSVLEFGRTIQNSKGQMVDDIVQTFIRNGTYDINSLMSEITTQLNFTPLFYDFPNGFQDFATRFAATGDFSINFNFPGDTYYDSLLNQFIANPSMSLIISKYFQSQYAGLSSYTTDQIKVAYYYPVIKEVLLDDEFLVNNPINLNITTSTPYLLPGETVRSRCIYTFQGLNDKVIQEVIALNIPLFDTYRLQHTYRYYLVNKYNVTLEPQSSRITISSPSLSTSLLNLLAYKQAQYFAEQLSNNGLTEDQYNQLQSNNTILLAIVNDMFYYIQRYLAVYFGIPFNTYDISYIANSGYTVPIRDATQAVGISSNYDINAILRNTAPITEDILSPLRNSAPQYWNRIQGFSTTTVAFPYNMETGTPTTSSNYPYSLLLDQQDRTRSFVDPSTSVMYANKLLRYADIVLPLNATEYTVFEFKSPVRQTLQVATLPRPTKYRYPAYNAVTYDVSHQVLFDNSYSFVSTSFNTNFMDVTSTFAQSNLFYIPGFSTFTAAHFGISYPSSTALWGSTAITNFIGNTRSFYQFQAPYPPGLLSSVAYRYPMSLTMASSNFSTFVTPMNMYVYHDRAAFMADVSGNRNETPFHYIAATSTLTDVSSTTIQFNVYAGQTYYVLARTRDLAVPTQRYRLTPWFPQGSAVTALTSSLAGFDPTADPTTAAALSNYNYATVADPAYIRLPISSNLMPSTVVDPLFTPLTFSTVALGYDASGVSTDLTHYQGFFPDSPASNSEPTSQIRIDPASGYLFQAQSPYNVSTQTYFYNGSANAILTSNGANVYAPGTVANRQFSIVHWYSDTYIPNTVNQPPMLSNEIAPSTYMSPYTLSTTSNVALTGYTYGGSNQALQLGDGVIGWSFAPGQGVWDIQRLMFKSAYTTGAPASDSNLSIEYLGIFLAAQTTNKFSYQLPLRESIAVLKKARAIAYDGSNLNFGFDTVGGTYYEYERDTTFRTGSNSYMYGYSQIRGQFNNDINAIYTIIPYDLNGKPLLYQGLAGSPVPYPYYSDVSAATYYFDGTATATGTSIVVPVTKGSPDPLRGPPAGYDETQSKYEQSMPIGTNLLSYVVPYPFITSPTSMKAWDPLPYAPSRLVADVSGFMLTQDSYFRVFEYTTGDQSSTFTETYQFTLDQVVNTSNPDIDYLGVAANESQYAFFAYSNDPVTPVNSKMLINTLTPRLGYAQDQLVVSTPFDFTSVQITGLTYNNHGGYTMTVKQGTTLYGYCQHTSTPGIYTNFSNTVANSTIDFFTPQQSPKESQGRFYVFPTRTGLTGPPTTGIIDYVYVDPTVTIGSTNPSYFYGADSVLSVAGPTVISQVTSYNLSNAVAPQIFRAPTVRRQPFLDIITLLSAQNATKLYEVTSYTASNSPEFTSNAIVTESAYSFPAATSNLYPGGNGALWALRSNIVYGNRNDSVDSPRKVKQAWQLFYPVQRIVFKQIAKNFTFMRDLSGLQYAEYPHTAILGYKSQAKLLMDISGRWGLESASNFEVADFGFSGEYFNGSVVSFPLQKSTSNYYLAVRNYTPTEKSQVMLRCSLNNRYDFGYVTMTDISNEVITAGVSSNDFDPDYYAALLGYNSNFVFGSNGKVFGANVVQGFNGSNFSNVAGFGDFYNRFVALYTQYNAQVQLVQSINSNVQQSLSNFISTDLQFILPSNVLSRQRFTDPLSFSIKWKSSLLPQYAKLEEQWGLGWNLGFDKQDTPFDTVQQAQSFFKILDDFISLRLNPEFDMNRMDTSLKENLAATLEPTGATKAFHAKLLLANFGSFAQTLVSNPLSFAPPLGRIDKLTFNWVDITGAIIDNNDCEWNMVVQVVEKKDMTEFAQPPRIVPR